MPSQAPAAVLTRGDPAPTPGVGAGSLGQAEGFSDPCEWMQPLQEAVCYSIPGPQHSWLAPERGEGLT